MKRSAMKPGTKPLKRTEMKNGRRPKSTPIRASARGEECTLRFPGICNCRTDTTVLCHSNLLSDGKGMGLKAPDARACYGCAACHDILDARRTRPGWLSYEAMLDIFERAVVITHERLKAKGLLPCS